ncbi:MAG: type II secretion system F family protein [Candidatus Omnitrophica bacterium]|nr:type II secretion system F family protein [Candidatus Omnitrophota bacterium]MDD5351546.1 type II secretion system F family protein [Candidatus Omnitrophota bacterium]MDD5550981.1 type II secretion system F family protein [Candidatus Omnitrophota bacterium]
MASDILKFVVFILIAGAIYVLASQGVQFTSVALKVFSGWRSRKIEEQKMNLKEMMLFIDAKKLVLFNTLSPTICTLVSAVFFGRVFGSYVIGALLGLAIGFLIPSIVFKRMIVGRKQKFHAQISDGLMILSSCLKGGLSLLQAIEALVEELPAPISQEFGIILRENKMGMSLEESFDRLNKRMPSEELNLLTTAILVARETGGDITQLFGTLINTIRAKLKLSDNVKTLSMQGKIQGVVMSLLPIVFTIMVYSFNPHYFDIMLSNPMGRGLLLYAVISEIVGVFLIRMFGRVNL